MRVDGIKNSRLYARLFYGAGAACAFFSLMLYAKTLTFGFVNWDDHLYVYANGWLAGSGWEWFTYAFTWLGAASWHPLTMFSYKLDYVLWGLDPFGYHLTNICIHSANVFLVYLLTARLLELAAVQSKARVVFAAAVAALFFGAHPIHVESVAWVSERKDVLSAFFMLLGVLLYLPAAHGDGAYTGRRRVLCFVFFCLALMSKPMAVTFPAVLVILDFYPLRTISNHTDAWRSVIKKAPFFALSIATGLLTMKAQALAIEVGRDLGIGTKIVNAVHSYGFYIYKTVFPLELFPIYEYANAPALLSAKFLIAAVFFAGVVALCVVYAKTRPYIGAVWAAYVVLLLPVIGLVQAGVQAAADRYMYLPSVPVFILAGAAGGLFICRGKKAFTALTAVIFAAALLLFSSKAYAQMDVWRDGVSLWTFQIEKTPYKNPIYLKRRADAFYERKMYEESLRDADLLIKVRPDMEEGFTARGRALYALEEKEKAVDAFAASIRVNRHQRVPYYFLYKYFDAMPGGATEAAYFKVLVDRTSRYEAITDAEYEQILSILDAAGKSKEKAPAGKVRR